MYQVKHYLSILLEIFEIYISYRKAIFTNFKNLFANLNQNFYYLLLCLIDLILVLVISITLLPICALSYSIIHLLSI